MRDLTHKEKIAVSGGGLISWWKNKAEEIKQKAAEKCDNIGDPCQGAPIDTDGGGGGGGGSW